MLINNYRSLFLLIRVQSGTVRFGIPLPLFLFTQILDAIAGWFWLWETLTPNSLDRLEKKQSRHNFRPVISGNNRPISTGLKLTRQLIKELRRYGRWRMVEVVSSKSACKENVRVYIDFI